MRSSSGLSRGALIGIVAGGLAVAVAVGAFLMSRSKGPEGPSPEDLARKAAEEREARISEILGQAEALEAKEEYAEALAKVGEAAALDAKHARAAAVKGRIETKKSKLEAWRKAEMASAEAEKGALAKDTPEAWQKVVDAAEAAEKSAPGEDRAKPARERRATALQRRDWAAAREAEKKGDFEGALKLVEQAMAAREAPAELAAYKESLGKKKRKKEFDRLAVAARAERDPKKALELWKQVQGFADEPKDAEEAKARIDALLPMTDPAERDRRYDAAMKRGDAALSGGDLDGAEKAFREAKGYKGIDTKADAALGRVDVAKKLKAYEGAMGEGKELEGKSDWIAATAAYDRALKSKPGDGAAGARLRFISETHRPPKIEIVVDATNGVKMEFLIVKPGTFTMGEAQGEFDEKPREVTMSKDFWMGATEVTQGQWKGVMGARNFAFAGRNELPADSVGWEDAQRFVAKLNAAAESQLRGRKAALPREAEWEYACRAGTKTRYVAGDGEPALEEVGWFTKNSGKETHPVGKKKANAWGLFDMHGNVAEWCADYYGDYPSGAATDPAGPDKGQMRVVRGGSWNDRADKCRSANREREVPESSGMFIGFRVVLR
jgi:formylglycine-generating enzyme required for sulfatase activity